MRSITKRFPASATQAEIEAELTSLSADAEVDGILLQLPLPKGLDEAKALEKIDPAKDVDGLTELSAGRLFLGKPGLRPCTPTGCVIMAKHVLGDDLSGKHVVVIGRSLIVGKPAALLAVQRKAWANATVTMCHSQTANLPALTRQADVLIAAIGRPEFVTADMVKLGAVVIDVGVNRVPDATRKSGYRLTGDVHFPSVAPLCSRITPVPGGVGPMTVAMLMKNTIKAFRLNSARPAV